MIKKDEEGYAPFSKNEPCGPATNDHIVERVGRRTDRCHGSCNDCSKKEREKYALEEI